MLRRIAIVCGLAFAPLLAARGAGTDLAPMPSRADAGGYLDVTRLHVDYRVEADGSYVETTDSVQHLISEQAVHAQGQVSVPYSSSLDRFEVLEARTLKANGRRIEVPAKSIFTQDGLISDKGLTSFQDIKTTVVVFPQLEAGDSIQLRTRVTRKRASLPGVFTMSTVFPGDMRYGDVTISVDAPASYPLNVKSVGLTSQEPVAASSRRIQRWTYSSTEIERTEEASVDPHMYRPHLLVSSLSDYDALSRAASQRFAGKAAVTPAIQARSTEIVAGAGTPLERARRIHQWVARNIRYFAVVLDVGGYVPRTADEVLSSRFGDCKDHTVLLQALLAAQGIESVPALLTTDPWYELPEVPVLESFNHVIPYVPSLDVFLETNARAIPFGALSEDELDKPVVLLAPTQTVRRTPAAKPDTNEIALESRIEIRPDGSATGTDVVRTQGASYIAYALMADAVAGMDPVQVARQFLIDRNLPGEGTISAAPSADGRRFEFSLLYEVPDLVDPAQEGGIRAIPPMDTFERTATAAIAETRTRRQAYQCNGRTELQDVTVKFPPGLKLTAPSNVMATAPNRTYTSSYEVKGSEVHIVRRYVSTVPHGWCQPEERVPVRAMEGRILRDLRSEIRYAPGS